MVLDRLRAVVWRYATGLHGDVRVAGFLRALSVVGMISGMSGFVVGMNPLVAAIVSVQFPVEATLLLKYGVLGLVVYSVSLIYYNATSKRMMTDEGLIRL
jgi:hypothetical protein